MMNERILEVIKAMDEDAIVALWNEYCREVRKYDDEIMTAYDMEEYIETCEDKMSLLNRFYFGSDDFSADAGSANPNRNYFCFNGYGNIVSFDYIYNSYSDEFYHMDIDDLVEYIEENEEAFGFGELEEVFEEFAEVEEV